MTDEKMRTYIAKQKARMQNVDPSREFEIFQIFQMKWQGRVLFELLEKSPRRFGELRGEVPKISNAVFSNVLRSLESKGLITRKRFNEIPPRAEYAITERGEAMLPIFYEMLRWEAEHSAEM